MTHTDPGPSTMGAPIAPPISTTSALPSQPSAPAQSMQDAPSSSSSDPVAPAAVGAASALSASTSTPAPAPAPTESHPLAQDRVSEEGKDGAAAVAGSSTPPVPKVHLRALVISGQSHNFSFEPELTVGRMKELLWSMWPSDWTSPAQPPSPAFLGILYAGRILQDDSTLGSNNMSASLTPTAPTVIHISVRSFSIRGEEDPKKGSLHPTTSRTRHANGQNEVTGCKCIIM